jgi:hypothetical protein
VERKDESREKQEGPPGARKRGIDAVGGEVSVG